MTSSTKRWRFPLLLSGLFLMSQGNSLPSPVRDAAFLSWVPGFHMQFPVWHLIFTPFCSTADYLTLLSLKQAELFCAYLFILLFVLLAMRRALIGIGLFMVYVAWAILVPRPMGRLMAQDPDILLIDFHSHTQYSHDGRPSFTPADNMRWHQRQGYSASFITDHNVVEASRIAKEISRQNWKETGYRSLEGEEASLYRTHLVVLGTHERVDNRPYDSDPRKIPVFVADMRKRGYPVIASIPEYWWYHWPTAPIGGDIDDFARWGMEGFEIVNSAPKALDFPLAYRARVVQLCRTKNLFMTGISDNHGYGYATAAWNAIRLPDWRSMGPDELEKAVLKHLKTQGFQAVQVLERIKYFPKSAFQLIFSPLANVWVYWRSLQLSQTFSWICWIWLFAFVQSSWPSRIKNR